MVLRRRAAVGGGEHGGGATELVGGPVPGEKEEGISRIPEPTLARAEVLPGGELHGGYRSEAAAMASSGARKQWAVAAGDARFRGGAEPLL